MITYMVCQNSKYQYTVSKWAMTTTPIEVYRVELHENGRSKCNCASGYHRGYCKHTTMVKEWIKRGMPLEEIEA